jgi:hypothetical protein
MCTADQTRLEAMASRIRPGKAELALDLSTTLCSVKNISKKGPQNRRSLGFARDDKKERFAKGKGSCCMESAVAKERAVAK